MPLTYLLTYLHPYLLIYLLILLAHRSPPTCDPDLDGCISMPSAVPFCGSMDADEPAGGLLAPDVVRD